ncbi:hypothetical protein GMLC_02230 [Geomonas limicola]|uniref:Smf/DprA SLOG domain-containing protein n=1 Tax=Geomonas limicola TaxID=2740186 RepID=A0A6V8N3T8_9BACT|nr:DNA-processing protein DprA [Geomonas limicola]GFO66644.1 hypothetical protein GMLC_02230 [Geomonas limicola]
MELVGLGAMLGNPELLRLHKTAFFASRSSPSEAVTLARGWFEKRCRDNGCIVSGFQVPLEKVLLDWLLVAGHPLVWVLARGLALPSFPGADRALAKGDLLVVTRYAESVSHPCRDKCRQRNRLIVELSDEIVVAYAAKGGEVAKLCAEIPAEKPVSFLAKA